MSTPAPLSVPRRLVRWARERVTGGGDEGGFVLMETMVALTLITVIMAAVGVEYVNGIVVSAHQRSVVSAAQVASTAMSELRSLDSSDLLNGRTLTAVTAQRDRLADIDKVKPWVSTGATKLAWNNAPSPAGIPVLTTAVTTPASGETFRVDKYLECQDGTTEITNADGTKQQSCGSSAATNTVRAVVVVGWDDRGCPTAGCAFVTSSLIDSHANPTFDLNQKLPAAPVVQAPGDQTVVVGDAVSLQLLVQDGKGAAPFTWALTAGSLPSGLSLSPAGLVNGTVSGSPTSNTSTVTVTDAFLRKAEATVKWTVLAKLAVGNVQPQTTTAGTSVTGPTITATGGSGSYTFTDPGSTLPAGLSINPSTGVISGTPTRPGVTSNVTITVTDSGKRTATTSFTWKVDYADLVVTNPGATTLAKDKAASIQVAVSGGSGSYAYRATNLPAGLSISSTGEIRGTPTTAGSPTVTVTVTDATAGKTQSVSFQISVVSAPIITGPGDQRSSRGASIDLAVTATCAGACSSYRAPNLPAGLTIATATGRITGTITAAAGSTVPVTVTVTDVAGNASTRSFSWQILASPKVTIGTTGDSAVDAVPSIPVDYTCANTPCTLTGTDLPAGLGLSTTLASDGDLTGTRSLVVTDTSGTVYVTGKVRTAAVQGTGDTSGNAYTFKVAASDADTVKDEGSRALTVWRRPVVTWPGRVTVRQDGTVSVAVTVGCTPGFLGSCRLTLAGAPDGVGISGSPQTGAVTTTSATVSSGTVYVTGKVAVGTTPGDYPVELTINQTGLFSTTKVTESWGLWTVNPR